MAEVLHWTYTCTAVAVVISVVSLILRARNSKYQQTIENDTKASPLEASLSYPTALVRKLSLELPDCVILPQNATAFRKAASAHWAKQETEAVPACVVQPRNIQDLSNAVTLINAEFGELAKEPSQLSACGIFAVRGGGHSAVRGAASLAQGIVVDLSMFKEVIVSNDGSSVNIGAGARWMDVSIILDEKGLAVAGGRNSDVGVGGLVLGGGLSYYSPRFGLVCSNIISYNVCLASGKIVEASATANSDLWRALKGGSNNFGIVTGFRARSFPAYKIWGGFLYLPSFQANRVLAAFHEFVGRADKRSTIPFDDHAAGPIASFTHIGDLGFQVVAVNLVYTKAPEQDNKWPECWKSSSFAPLWRIWSTCKTRSLTSATDELNDLNPSGKRQELVATTVKNDAATLAAAYSAYRDTVELVRRRKVKGMNWTMVLQPMVPEWARKGDPNPLGLDEGTDDPLVIVIFNTIWINSCDDEFVETTTRHAIEQIEAFATANGTAHRYRYLNYCARWQEPFQGYGEENLQFMRMVSRKYDPEGLFQRGCVGGFKLGLDPDE